MQPREPHFLWKAGSAKSARAFFFLEGFLSAAAGSLKKKFSPLGQLLLYSLGTYVHIQVLLYIGISDGLNQDLRTQVWWDAALPGEQL